MQARETALTEELEKFSRQRGADLFGVADLACLLLLSIQRLDTLWRGDKYFAPRTVFS